MGITNNWRSHKGGTNWVSGHLEYDPFGNIVNRSGYLSQPYQWSSKENDGDGLVYYLRRFYNANQSRWMNRDPLHEIGGINLYGFVRNSPVKRIDPYGLDFTTATADAGAVLATRTEEAGAAEVVGLGPEDPVADVAAGAIEAEGLTEAGLIELDEAIAEGEALLAKEEAAAARAAAAPMGTIDFDPVPDVPLTPDQDEEEGKKCKCKIKALYQDLGSNEKHHQYVKKFFQPFLNLEVTTPEGLTVSFDGGNNGENSTRIYELKTGRRWATQRVLSKVQDSIFNKDLNQFAKQTIVASECHLKYEIWFEESIGRTGYAARIPILGPYMSWRP